jgi:tetratricopeptide (TPR) repeat protein
MVVSWKALVIGLAWLVVLVSSAHARQDDERLDALFDKLQTVEDFEVAHRLVGSIWKIWYQSGSDTIDLLIANGDKAMTTQRYERALELFTAAINLDPEYAEAWNRRATLNYAMGRYDDSVRDIQKTLALEPRHFGALSGLGLIYDALDKPEGALKAYREAVSINPHIPHAVQRIEILKKQVEGAPI